MKGFIELGDTDLKIADISGLESTGPQTVIYLNSGKIFIVNIGRGEIKKMMCGGN